MNISEETHGEIAESLGQAIFRLSWIGEFWGRGGAIFFAKIRRKFLKKDVARAISSLSAVYYAAAGNARAHARHVCWKKPIWLFRSGFCFRRAKSLSEKLVNLAGGIEKLTPRQLEIRGCILRTGGQYEEALNCIGEALSRNHLSNNLLALLHMGRGEALIKAGLFAEANEAFETAMSLKGQVPIITKSRLFRAYALFKRMVGQEEIAISALEEARKIAEDFCLKDQMAKTEIAL